MMNKICNKCEEEKSTEEFSNDKNRKDGKYPTCKTCMKKIWHERKDTYKERSKKYREENKERLNEYYKQYRDANRDKKAKYDAKYRSENVERRREYNRQYRKDHATEIAEYKKTWTAKQRKENVEFRIKRNLRRRIAHAISRNAKSDNTMKLLGCDIEHFKKHLELKFKDGMTWENYGSVWVIDHVRPCASFDLLQEREQRKCFNYKNTQPLFKEENLIKADKYEEYDEEDIKSNDGSN